MAHKQEKLIEQILDHLLSMNDAFTEDEAEARIRQALAPLMQQLAQTREETTYLRSERLKLEAKVRFERGLNAIHLKQRLRLQDDLDQAQALLHDASGLLIDGSGPECIQEWQARYSAFRARPEGDSDDE
jgi:hypothetical protein